MSIARRLAWAAVLGAAMLPAAIGGATRAEAASRSVQVQFVNKSDVGLSRTGDNLDHGCWTTEAPARIEANSTVTWESESCGVATGTEGEADYALDTGGTAHFHWDNPFVGSNSYDESVSPVGYAASHSGGDGDNATVTWNFDCSSSTCDGIPDDWKKNGVNLDPGDGSGPQFIDLPNMGATIGKPDVFVQLDWMADTAHTHQLSNAAVQAVVAAFANAPYVSRTGSVGINLHVDHGPNSILNPVTNQTWGTLSRARQQAEVTNLGTGTATSYSWSAFDGIKNTLGNFKSTGRTAIFHYAIAAHQISTLTNSGVSRSSGNGGASDLIISLGSFAPVTGQMQSGTFMHELGHNLGLAHGGGDGTNNKPNYLSVMNYLFQFPGLTRGGASGVLDYSRGALGTLNEAALDETTGDGTAAAGFGTSHWCPPTGGNPGAFVAVVDASKAIDWNCNGVATDNAAAADTNNDGSQGPLTGFDDWKNLKFKVGAVGTGEAAPLPMDTPVEEITPDQAQRILPLDTTPPVTAESQAPPPNANGWNRTAVTVTLSATDDISGVARTEFTLDGSAFAPAPAPVTIGTEGVHALQYRSIDRAQNVEAIKHATVRIDLTPPEAVITYDPAKHEITVTGRDALSGVAPGPIPPASVAPTAWTAFGSDVAEQRSYRIEDRAGNSLDLVMKVRREPDEIEFSVTSLIYNANESSSDADRQAGQQQYGVERNTTEFGRLRGRGLGHALLAVSQEFALGQGEARTTLDARYNVLCDETEVSQHGRDEPSSFEREGLALIRLVTGKGTLRLEHD